MKTKYFIITLLVLITSTASAAYEFEATINGKIWTCEILSESDKTVTIIDMQGYVTDGSNVTTPQTITDAATGITYSVVSLGKDTNAIYYSVFDGYNDEEAFCSAHNYTIVVSEGVTSIHQNTFWGLSGNGKIYLPYSLTSISPSAFFMCDDITIYVPITSSLNINPSNCTVTTRPFAQGDVFKAMTQEGIEMTFKVSDAESKIAGVGDGENVAIDPSYEGDLIIPSNVYGLTIKYIRNKAFYECKNLHSVTLPNSIEEIWNSAFEHSVIGDITIPPTLHYLGKLCFSFSVINQLDIPYSENRLICESTDRYARVFDDVTIGTLSIDRWLAWPNISGNYWFAPFGPNSKFPVINKIYAGIHASFACERTQISDYYLPEGLTNLNQSKSFKQNVSDVRYDGGKSTISNLHIPEGVTTITKVYSAETTNIPSTVTNIAEEAFSECYNLSELRVYISNPLPITESTFYNASKTTLYVPYGSKAAYEAADYWKEFKEIVEMEPPVNIDDTFIAAVPCGDGTANLTFKVTNATPWEVEVISSPENIAGALTIPATVTDENGIEFAVKSIGEDAFRGRALTSVVLPTGICTINSDAFRESGLESITFPSTLSAVWHGAFQDCKQLESIDFNHCPAYFEYDCFLGCSNLKELYIPNTVQFRNSDNTWAWNIFGSCTSLKTVTFEAFEEGQSRWSTTTLFPYCSALETVVLPSMSVMQQSFFWNSKNLKDITILEIEDDFDARYYSFNKMFQDHQAKDIQFTVPAGKAETMLKAGYINLSDKSGLPIVRTEFESEAARITTMANALNDGAKASLITAIANARSAVNAAEDYATVYAQIDAIKTAAKTFLTTTTVPANFDITAVILNPDFEQLQLGWNVQNDWVNYPNVNKRGWNGASYENGEVSIDKFIDTWENTTLKDGDISQTIKALPAGIYRLEADIIATNQNNANAEVTGVSLFAGSQKTAVATKNEKPQHFSVEFTLEETDDCTIGINVNNTNANWVAMDNVRLYSVGSQEDQNNTDISQLDNAIYIEPFTTRAGVAVKIPINLKNAEAATAYVFDLVLPEGITVAKNSNGKYMDELSDRHDNYIPIFNYKGENTYGLSTLPGNSEELTGNDGPIRFVTLHVENAVEEGVYPILIKNASYSKPNGNLVTLADTKSSVTIETIEGYVLGDVNGNGGVDIGDAVSIVSYLVGKESSNFVAEAADTNNNGQIDIGDAVIIVNLLVGKITHFTREFNIIWDEKEPE